MQLKNKQDPDMLSKESFIPGAAPVKTRLIGGAFVKARDTARWCHGP